MTTPELTGIDPAITETIGSYQDAHYLDTTFDVSFMVSASTTRQGVAALCSCGHVFVDTLSASCIDAWAVHATRARGVGHVVDMATTATATTVIEDPRRVDASVTRQRRMWTRSLRDRGAVKASHIVGWFVVAALLWYGVATLIGHTR